MSDDRAIEVPCIIVCGNPADGFHHIGPFNTYEDANTYGEDRRGLRDDDWWTIEIEPPVEGWHYENANAAKDHRLPGFIESEYRGTEVSE